MTYHLGIDLGTTFTAAAICGPDGRARMVSLGDHGTSVPSVLLLNRDGGFVVGDAAVRRAIDDPDRVARETKRRMGDSVPIMLGGSPYSAALLQARLLRWVVDRVVAEQGSQPAGVAVTHPASWGPYKLEELRSAIRQVDVDVTTLLPEPVAAATSYATERVIRPGAAIAVYDLGGGTFDCCVVRRDEDTGTFGVIGTPEGIDRLGGIDFDEAVFDHVRRSLGGVLDGLDGSDPATLAGLAHLRRECTAAKEALSADTTATISVLLPNVATTVRIGRAELEAMIRPALAETITALRRTIRTAGMAPEDLEAVLLVGGSSRIPQVSQLVGAELGRPVVVDAHPKDAIALGAALAVAAGSGVTTSPPVPPPSPPPASWSGPGAPTGQPAAAPATGAPDAAPGRTEGRGGDEPGSAAAAAASGPAAAPPARSPEGAAGASGHGIDETLGAAGASEAAAPVAATGRGSGAPASVGGDGGGRPRPSRRALVLGGAAVLAVVAIVGAVLAGGGGGGDDDGGFDRADTSSEVDTVEIDDEEIDPEGEGIVLRSISVPDTAMLVIRGSASEDLVISVFGHEDAEGALSESNEAIFPFDPGVVADYFGTSSTIDVTDRDLVSDEVEADLPPILLATSDDVSTGEEEVLFLPFLRAADMEVGFTNYAGEEVTSVDARIDAIDLDIDPEDVQAFIDAVRSDRNVSELLPELDDL